jgi:hypothetical protein
MDLAPIAFFAYNRPDHTLKALTSLAQCELAGESHLHIFCDGPKNLKDEENVLKVREVAASLPWCHRVEIIPREKNYGCANSVISGLTSLLDRYDRLIVVEDDLLLSPDFLHYMNLALERYQKDEKVIQISGFMFPVNLTASTDAIFLPYITSWGWATWQRAWRHFDPQKSGYTELKKNRTLRHAFNLYGAYGYFDILKGRMEGIIDTWDIDWYLSTFMMGGLTLHPVKTLVQNIGFDASGTHCGVSQAFVNSGFSEVIRKFPEPSIDLQCFSEIIEFLKVATGKRRPLAKKIINKIRYLLNSAL